MALVARRWQFQWRHQRSCSPPCPGLWWRSPGRGPCLLTTLDLATPAEWGDSPSLAGEGMAEWVTTPTRKRASSGDHECPRGHRSAPAIPLGNHYEVLVGSEVGVDMDVELGSLSSFLDRVGDVDCGYAELFSRRACDPAVETYLLDCISARLGVEEVRSMEADVTLEEVREALLSLRDGRAPGHDGLPKEFYAAFWHLLGRGALSASMRKGILVLLYKGGDQTELGNWRPLTLLTTDCKVLAKVATAHLRRVMGGLVSQDQTCGVPGRLGFGARLSVEGLAGECQTAHLVPRSSVCRERLFGEQSGGDNQHNGGHCCCSAACVRLSLYTEVLLRCHSLRSF
ncbi:hypothetical protein AAFF_G00245270 [Aldrovandia affinis]|uniref:Uncharacterized protein n=1 Tax=Aldrovandia affinis TaxID=143900 RepID=A0AAD7RG63_9TELE|nr:hypothetical protein AAFF_G00245270 [Aldrovandia affinis]